MRSIIGKWACRGRHFLIRNFSPDFLFQLCRVFCLRLTIWTSAYVLIVIVTWSGSRPNAITWRLLDIKLPCLMHPSRRSLRPWFRLPLPSLAFVLSCSIILTVASFCHGTRRTINLQLHTAWNPSSPWPRRSWRCVRIIRPSLVQED